MLPALATQIRDAAIQNEVRAVGRGDERKLSEAAIRYVKARLVDVITPTSICEVLGFSVFEANRLIQALLGQRALADTVKITRRAGGKEWGYSWARA